MTRHGRKDHLMLRHRLALEADHYRLPVPRAPQFKPGSFQLYPTGVLAACSPEQLTGICELYKSAFDRAYDAARKSHPSDALFSVWN